MTSLSSKAGTNVDDLIAPVLEMRVPLHTDTNAELEQAILEDMHTGHSKLISEILPESYLFRPEKDSASTFLFCDLTKCNCDIPNFDL